MEQENKQTTQNNSSRLIIVGLLAVIAIGVLYLIFGKGENKLVKTSEASISGEIDFNGIKPDSESAESDVVEINLKYKKNNSNEKYQDAGLSVTVADEATWNWEGAESGITYDLVGELYYEDILVATSSRSVVTAPATDIAIVFNVTQDDVEVFENQLRKKLNISSAPEATTTPTPELAVISGKYTINGYIPSGATIRAYGRRVDQSDTKFEELRRDVTAKKDDIFTYDQAYAGATYEYQAELYDANGNFIGQSPYITVTAPAYHEEVVINSTAEAPVQKANVAGNIKVNGPFKQDSTLLLLQRKHGDSEYKEIKRFSANKSVNFKWTDAVSGATYDITVALQVGGNNVATGNVKTVAAPASSVNLEVDTNFNLSAPTEKPALSCGDRDSTNHFNARVSVPDVKDAKKYHLEIGTSAGANNIFNGQVNPQSSEMIYIQADSPHFARYSYSACTDCDINDSTNWSGWSPTLGFKCP